MTGDQGEHGPRWREGTSSGSAMTTPGGMTCICDGSSPETLEMVDGYWVGREAGLQQREAAPEEVS